MIDVDVLVKDLDDLVTGLIRIQKKNMQSYGNLNPSSLINISVNVTARSLEDTISNNIREKIICQNNKKEPLIDVMETGDKIRIIATLPGLKTEDIWFDVNHEILTVGMIKYGQVLQKQIQCSTKPGQILLRSSTVNNSVLELVFDKV